MKKRFRLIRRGVRGGKFYCVDSLTGKRTSLQTANEDEAAEIVAAKNHALRQPILNLQLAKAYLAGVDSGITTRTWRNAVDALIETKHGANQVRWKRVTKDKAFGLMWERVIVETGAEILLRVLRVGTVSTNVFLRRLHNFCLDMNWLPWPIIPKKQWPPVRHKEKRAITLEEHLAIVVREANAERKAFYELAWHIGASQSDIAGLQAEDIDWENRSISYARMKTKQVARVRFGDEVAVVLRNLPKSGPLFPYLIGVREADRATEFRQRCKALGIEGVTLHSYRLHTRFARFINVPELMQQFRQVADIQTQAMLKLPIPDIRNGKPMVINAPCSRQLKKIVESLVKRAEALRTGMVDPREDNMLLITTDGRKAALDLRLHDPSMPDHRDSKVNLAVVEIHRVWWETAEQRLTQLVFCDLSISSTSGRPGRKNATEIENHEITCPQL